jgi:hypothetical protein
VGGIVDPLLVLHVYVVFPFRYSLEISTMLPLPSEIYIKP